MMGDGGQDGILGQAMWFATLLGACFCMALGHGVQVVMGLVSVCDGMQLWKMNDTQACMLCPGLCHTAISI
jgi:hypothetical protein